MLVANLSKSPSLSRILTLKRPSIPALGPASLALDQLIDLFNLGADRKYNPTATYDYLAYVFADLAKVRFFPIPFFYTHFQRPLTLNPQSIDTSPPHSCLTQYPPTTTHLLSRTPTDPLPPLTKLLPSTTSPSLPRRTGLALVLKNLTLTLPTPHALLTPPISILPFLLLPLCGPHTDSISEAETEALLPELQYLGAEQVREKDVRVLAALLESLYLLVVKGGRRAVADAGAYVVVRECHVEVEDEGVREVCERLVQVLMQEEEEGEGGKEDVQGERTEKEKKEESSQHPHPAPDSHPKPPNNAATESSSFSSDEEDDENDEENSIVQIF